MPLELKIQEGNYYGVPHFFISHGEYEKNQRRQESDRNSVPLSREEKMLVALCERVLDLTAVNASLRELAAPAGSYIMLCYACMDAKGMHTLERYEGQTHCECCGRFGHVWKFSRSFAMERYCKNTLESRRKAREAISKPPPKHYYELRASSHENKVKILEWMREGVAEMDHGNAGWSRSDVLYPNALYRKLVTDKDGYLVDPEFISTQISSNNVLYRGGRSTDWTVLPLMSVRYIADQMANGQKYKLKGDV